MDKTGPAGTRGLPSTDLRLSRGEGIQVAVLYGVLALATGLGFYVAFRLGQEYLVLAGLGLIAYILGLRHGFDADHIAAIDNTTRKLLHDGGRPLTVGTWFSLGHSTIVCGLIVALVAATNFIQGHVAALNSIGTVLGALISGGFLVVIGIVNLLIVASVYALFQRAKRGRMSDQDYESQMNQRGFLYRYFYRLFRVVKKPWQIYPIGVLFGLGFDTATEVALIALTVGVGTVGGVPLWTALILPFMFTVGMVLSDTTDGVAMRYAYGWAFNHPIRKIFYNLTLTVISVLVAFFVGGIELLQVLGRTLGFHGAFWNGLEGLSFETLGVGIVVLFLVCWGIAMLVYRLNRYEQAGLGGASGGAVAGAAGAIERPEWP
jgi:nickel/cobalt transporter (NiCoT) family protein